MKYFLFSEAIRDGAKLTPVGSQYLLLNREGGTCALGAGAIAMGLPTEKADGWNLLPDFATCDVIMQAFPYLRAEVKCPADGNYHDLRHVIADLFDVERWTREAIADWLETEEEKLGLFVTLNVSKELPAQIMETSKVLSW